LSNLAVVHSQGSVRGTQREYECVLILKPSTTKDGTADLLSRFSAILEKGGARLQAVDNWGLRTLAYPIKKQKQGIYLYTRFLGGSDLVLELERNLRIWQDVVRYMSVVVDEDVDPGARPSEIESDSLANATDAGEDPVEIAKAEAAKARAEAAAVAKAEAEAAAAAAAKAAEERAAAAAAEAAAAPAPAPEGEEA
jgi:small subunit ribosomal protein S6